MFRGVRVGTVLGVNLASDGSAVDARVIIEKAYAALVRERTRFWDSGGVRVDASLTGLKVDIESLPAVMVGSVTFATPPEPGDPVRTGHRFRVAREAESDWLEWTPTLAVGDELLPPGARIPHMERAQLFYETSVLKLDRYRTGWVLPIERGVLGPTDLLQAEEDAAADSSTLSIAGESISLKTEAHWRQGGLSAIPTPDISDSVWPRSLMRRPVEPEDCVIIGSASRGAAPLAAVRLTEGDGFWRVDESISFNESWHGACVLSRLDGLLVGLLLVSEGTGRVALLPPEAIE
jgi:hypothetical protein